MAQKRNELDLSQNCGIVCVMYAVCIAELDDGLRHARESYEGLQVTGGLSKLSLCGVDVVWDAGEVTLPILHAENFCAPCRKAIEALLVA